MLGRVVFLYGYALLFAAVEVEIEGPHGWAERLPTWFRVRPWYARAFGALMGGKPLTGYHAVMLPLTLWSFHMGFASGVPWTAASEVATCAAFFAWAVVWDFLWFVLNPDFTWSRFRAGAVWWHGQRWIGRFPIDYYRAFASSLALALIASALARGGGPLRAHLVLLAGLCALTALTVPLAPLYHRWHRHMRRPGSDERRSPR